MNFLCVDVGNTRTKAAVYAEGQEKALEFASDSELSLALVEKWKKRYGIQHAIASNVSNDTAFPLHHLERILNLHLVNAETPLSFRVDYKTPTTLGTDRLACMSGVHALYPYRNVLVIQCGTCLTYDLLIENSVYVGGGISPGLIMRLIILSSKAHHLPLVTLDPKAPLIGQTTAACIQAGVLHGYLSECEGMIEKYSAKYDNLMVVLAGGDADLVHDKIKMPTFVFPNLVLYGLMTILKYDLEKQ